MKKIVSLILVLAMLCGLASAASAQASLTPYVTLPKGHYTMFEDTNMLRMNSQLYTLDGQPLVTDSYYVSFVNRGLIEIQDTAIEGVNCSGAVDLNGNIVVPAQYGVLKVLNCEWVLGMALKDATSDNYDYTGNNKTTYYLIDRVDVYNITRGGMVATLAREQYIDASQVYHYINIQDRATGVISTYDADFNLLGSGLSSIYGGDYTVPDYSFPRENGRRGIVDAAGNVICEPSFGTVYDLRGDYFMVSNDNFYGLVNLAGETVVEPAYEKILTTSYGPYFATFDNYYGTTYDAFGYVAVVKDGKLGYVDLQGNVTYEPKYSKDLVENYGASALVKDLTGNYILLAADGVETALPAYAKIDPLSNASGVFYKVRDENGNQGMIDWHGNVILPMEYEDIDFTGDGKYVMVQKSYDELEVYAVTYPGQAAATEDPAATNRTGGLGGIRENLQNAILGGGAATETPADTNMDVPADVPADAPAADNSASAALLTSAATLLSADPAANKDAALTLINTAAASLAGNASVAPLLTSVVTLLNADAAANGASAVTLLNTIISML